MAEATAAVAAASSCREAVAAVNVTMAVPLPCPDIEVYHIILAVKFHSHYMTTQCTFTDEFLVACTSANVAPVRGAVKEKQKYCILYAEYIINKNRRKKTELLRTNYIGTIEKFFIPPQRCAHVYIVQERDIGANAVERKR